MNLSIWPRALFAFSRPLFRIAKSLETIAELYRLDLQSRGIFPINPDLRDEVEIAYGPQVIKRTPEDEDEDNSPYYQ